MQNKNDLTNGGVAKRLFHLAGPMVFGIFSIVIFNIVDTFFVAQLGKKELAA
ncbi:MAG: MATE family efflux transporter, partial [Candidatus Omnitrophica bacterium]|nr:MATE family efflux transporter [Candidatus Omnitrophota bacterium]